MHRLLAATTALTFFLHGVSGQPARQDGEDVGPLRVRLERRSIELVDPAFLGMQRARTQPGAPTGFPVTDPGVVRQAKLEVPGRDVRVAFSGDDDGEVWFSDDGRLGATPKEQADEKGWFASLELSDGWRMRLRWIRDREMLLERSMVLVAGEAEVDGKRHTIGFVHVCAGGAFSDLVQLVLLVDEDGDGRFAEAETRASHEPFRLGERAFRIASLSPDGDEAVLEPYASDRGPVRGFLFPDSDVLSVADGTPASLDEVLRGPEGEGSYTVLNIWARNCAPCIVEMPELNDLVDEFDGLAGVRFVAVAPGDPESLREFLGANPFVYEQYCARSDAEVFQGAFPRHLVLSPEGRVLHVSMGGGPGIGEQLREVIAKSVRLVETVAKAPEIVDGLHVDPDGAVYTTPGGLLGGEAIGRVLPDGSWERFATGLPGAIDIDADSSGQLYVTCYDDNTLRRVDPETREVELVAEGLDGPAGVHCLPNDTVLVTNYGAPPSYAGHTIVAIDPEGRRTTFADGDYMYRPQGLAASDDAVFVAGFRGTIHRIDRGTGEVALLAELGVPLGNMLLHGNALYVAAVHHHKVFRVTLEGEVEVLAGTGAPGDSDGAASSARFRRPLGLATSNDGRWLYVSEAHGKRLRRIRIG